MSVLHHVATLTSTPNAFSNSSNCLGKSRFWYSKFLNPHFIPLAYPSTNPVSNSISLMII